MIIVPPMPVGDLGSMLVMADAGQAAIGAWQPAAFNGFGVLYESGAPSWFELHTRAYDTAVAFYKDVFGWDAHTVSDADDFRYTTLGEGGDQRAGIMDASSFLPEGVPSNWQVYFQVDNADATLTKLVELGGSITQPAEDTPYGRIAGVADSTGAAFRLRQLL
jgi:predicted enzyme related to lactoylglutathione lyase